MVQWVIFPGHVIQHLVMPFCGDMSSHKFLLIIQQQIQKFSEIKLPRIGKIGVLIMGSLVFLKVYCVFSQHRNEKKWLSVLSNNHFHKNKSYICICQPRTSIYQRKISQNWGKYRKQFCPQFILTKLGNYVKILWWKYNRTRWRSRDSAADVRNWRKWNIIAWKSPFYP